MYSRGRQQAGTASNKLKPQAQTKPMSAHVASGIGAVGILHKLGHRATHTRGKAQGLEKLRTERGQQLQGQVPPHANKVSQPKVMCGMLLLRIHLPNLQQESPLGCILTRNMQEREFWKM